MQRIALVCDSTLDLDPVWLLDHQVRMVPLKVMFGDQTWLDWVEMRPQEFYERLAASSSLPKTSQPSPAEFEAAYRELAEEGATQIVSIHLSSLLSGTVQSALIAAQTSPVPVRVVDTKLASQAATLVLKAAIAARDAGKDADEVERIAWNTASDTRLFFVLDTLEYLVKGGRAGKATGLAASLLDIKPVLTVTPEGEVAPFAKVKGLKKAMRKLAEHVAQETAERGRMRASLLHACAPARAKELAELLAQAGADLDIESTGLVGAVIGTYAGPGAVGIAFHPAE